MKKFLRFSFMLLMALVCNTASAYRLQLASTSNEWNVDFTASLISRMEAAGEGWTFASVTPAEGKVTELQKMSFYYPDGILWAVEYVTLKMQCPGGKEASVMLGDNFMGACDGTVLDQVLTAAGTYKLTIPAGTFSNGDVKCGAMTYTWTIEGEEKPDTPQVNPDELDGEKRQESLFAKGDLGDKMLNEVTLETEGVSMVGVPFYNASIDFNVPVRYNQNEEGKINWNSGTKLVFTAKDNITGIIIDGDFAQFADADKGNYVNGAWSGLLKAGETLTLTSNDGINIQSIIVLYNGAELQIEQGEVTDVKIEYNLTKTSWAKIGSTSGEVIGTVSSNTPNFDHYMFTITCDDDPDQFISFADLRTIEGDIVCFTPEGSYDLYNGQNYTLHIYVYDTPQYGAQPVAETTYKFVGTGVAPTVYNTDITVAKIYLKENSQGLGYNVNGTKFDVEFTAPVASVSAVWAKGFEGSSKFATEKKNESGTIWTVIMDESVLGQEGGISVNIVAADADGHQLKSACDNTPYGISIQIDLSNEPVEEIAGATLIVGQDSYDLSTETATEFGELPEGAVFTYNLTQEGTKTVTFQIYDVTAGSILKSVATCQSFDDGVASFTLPIKYALASGHQYEAQFKEYSTMSTYNKVPTAEQNFKFSGTADVAVYSTVKVVNLTPGTGTLINDPNQTVSITFSEAIASLTVKAVLGQMASTNVPASDITTEDNITWNVKLDEFYFTEGSLSLNFYATDKEGNRVTDPRDGVGSPETCYLQYGWASTYGLPTPTLVQNGKTYEKSVGVLSFKYDGIGLNQNALNATWNQIVIEKDGVPMDITITENMFSVMGDESVGGTQLNLTLPTPLEYNGVYTVKVPAYAFMLGHDNSNFLSGDAEYTFTITNCLEAGPTMALNITKTDWSKIGSQNGEAIGTVTMEGADAFDHIEAEIRCQEDPDQYISFANTNTNGGELVCYAWEGGYYNLNKGYHYTLTVKGFDVPYYGVAPVAVTTYEFVGTGKEATKYSDIEIAEVLLEKNDILYHGYNVNGTTFDVVFSAPVARVDAWEAMGFDGSRKYQASKKDDEGLIWTIIMPEDVLTNEGSVNVMITAWDAAGLQIKGETGDHAYPLNIFISNSDPDGIAAMQHSANKVVYTLDGVRVNAKDMRKGQLYIVNGVKVRK